MSKKLFLRGLGALMMTAVVAAASGGGDGAGGVAPQPPANVTPGQLLLRESFGFGANLVRPTGGGGTMKPVGVATDISSFWAENPGNASEVWTAPGGKQVQAWAFSASSVNPKEAPSPLDNGLNSNGTLTVGAAPATGSTNPAALLPFAPPPIPYEVSVDVAQQPRTATEWVAVGFTSSNAVNHNLENAGQAWMLMKITNVQVDFYHVTLELHTNGMAGPTVSTQAILTSFDTMTVRYDPVQKTATGLFNGVPFGTLAYAASGINHVGVEANATLNVITVDNFLVKASN
jgi:hypothetical protein